MQKLSYTILVACVLLTGCVWKSVPLGPGCDETCSGATPVCDELGGACVECVGDSECADPARPFCVDHVRCVECESDGDCTNESCVDGVCGGCRFSSECGEATPVCHLGLCVGCSLDADCGGSTPLCDTSAGTCGECVDDGDCALGVCAAGECVECVDSEDCTAAEPRCDTSTNRCAACSSSADCGGATPHCDVVSGACGACTADTEAAECGGNTCNVTTLTCTTTPVGSVPSCGECVADSDCSQAQGTARCVETQYMGVSDGYHCLLEAPGCMRPFASSVDGVSISGAPEATYCAIDATLATCAALVALRDGVQCPSGDAVECSAVSAVCSQVGVLTNRCTYPCNGADDCPGTRTCSAGTCGS